VAKNYWRLPTWNCQLENFPCPQPQRLVCSFQIERFDAPERFAVINHNHESTGAKPIKKQNFNVKASIFALNSSL